MSSLARNGVVAVIAVSSRSFQSITKTPRNNINSEDAQDSQRTQREKIQTHSRRKPGPIDPPIELFIGRSRLSPGMQFFCALCESSASFALKRSISFHLRGHIKNTPLPVVWVSNSL